MRDACTGLTALVKSFNMTGRCGPDAAEDVEFLFLSISRRLRDRDAIRREAIAKYVLPRAALGF
jgi:hypothetical protein